MQALFEHAFSAMLLFEIFENMPKLDLPKSRKIVEFWSGSRALLLFEGFKNVLRRGVKIGHFDRAREHCSSLKASKPCSEEKSTSLIFTVFRIMLMTQRQTENTFFGDTNQRVFHVFCMFFGPLYNI